MQPRTEGSGYGDFPKEQYDYLTILSSWAEGSALFEDGGDQKALDLVDSKTFGTGVVYLTYQPARR
jgi:hypothetical protein